MIFLISNPIEFFFVESGLLSTFEIGLKAAGQDYNKAVSTADKYF
jgi:hypothetical protein